MVYKREISSSMLVFIDFMTALTRITSLLYANKFISIPYPLKLCL